MFKMNTKGMALASFAIGLIVVFVGVALSFMLPELIIDQLGAVGTFNATAIATARTKAGAVRDLGYVVIIIGVIWTLITVVSNKP